ncbi:MAG: CoA transferase [Rhodospirillales bacterium]|nr:CoA transferase [Rhodospirillales bacterium]
MELPLNDLLVVALEQAVAAPYCSSRLADAGARVIKIEREEGDFARKYDSVVHGESAYFVWLNRGKESLILNIKDQEDFKLLEKMLERADVFIQNLAPGATERAGLGSESLRNKYPHLITCDISGYGDSEAFQDMRAYDLLVQAETGLCSVTGTPDGPGRVGVSVCDIAAGMYAYQGILEALFEREKTGRGKGVEVSLFDGMADWMAVPLLHANYGGKAPERVGLRHPSIAPYTAFRTGDGDEVVISIQNEREWARFAEDIMENKMMSQEGPYKDAASRMKNRDVLEKQIAEIFAKVSTLNISRRLKQAKIAFGQVNQVVGLSNHQALRRITVESPSGPVDLPAPPVKFSGETRSYGPVPGTGEHSERIRNEFLKDN